mmetsp:Transcript_4784/g.10218  ORF Transcript_4784/g.10218 Transcript_4784/m.10218 type:complete len:306 (-) Transcript_4784:595-1512(-)
MESSGRGRKRANSLRSFYAVHRGRGGFQGVVNTWSECSMLVTGVPGSVFKKFDSEQDALSFARTGRTPNNTAPPESFVAGGNQRLSKRQKRENAFQKRMAENQRKLHSETRRDPRDHQLRDIDGSRVFVVNQNNNSNTNTNQLHGEPTNAVRHIYTDGACSQNGKRGARAGVGVYFGDESFEKDISERLEGTVMTNNRAELTAVIRALEAIQRHEWKDEERVVVWTDSKYTRSGVEEWVAGWKRNGWKTASGGDVKNKDLWVRLDELRSGCGKMNVEVSIKWVKAHAGLVGNEKADQLAVRGAQM